MIEALTHSPFNVVAVVPATDAHAWVAKGWRTGRCTTHTVTCYKRFGSEFDATIAARQLNVLGVVWSLEKVLN